MTMPLTLARRFRMLPFTASTVTFASAARRRAISYVTMPTEFCSGGRTRSKYWLRNTTCIVASLSASFNDEVASAKKFGAQ